MSRRIPKRVSSVRKFQLLIHIDLESIKKQRHVWTNRSRDHMGSPSSQRSTCIHPSSGGVKKSGSQQRLEYGEERQFVKEVVDKGCVHG